MKRTTSLLSLVLLIAFLALFESILIFIDVLPPTTSYSVGNLLFSIARLGIIIYSGVIFYNEGLKKSSFYGGILGFVTASIVSLASFISRFYFGKPILGISVPSASYYLVMTIIVIENILLGAIVAAGASWITKKLSQR